MPSQRQTQGQTQGQSQGQTHSQSAADPATPTGSVLLEDPDEAFDPYAAGERETTEGKVYTVTGGDWDALLTGGDDEQHMVVNMGPQHPSTHGVLRLVLELEGETVTSARTVIGYLHTGIEKNLEYRNWVQGVTFVTRMDYLAPLFNEAAYCMGVEKLLGIEVPERARVIRVLLMELNRMRSHLVGMATMGLELGALTGMLNGLREGEMILDVLEMVTGLRMNHAFVRPGGVAQDLPPGTVEKVRELLVSFRKNLPGYDDLLTGNPIWQKRLMGVAALDAQGCIALGVTGPLLRAAGLAWDLRKVEPYLGYERYEFDVPTETTGDGWARFRVRLRELYESLKIIEQCLDDLVPGPVMVADTKIAWPAQLALGADGMGQSLDHVKKIMGTSMEALIHHFKLVTEGFRVPPGQVYVPIESPRGELGFHMVSDGGTRPYRVHVRDPSFVNLQALSATCEGGLLSDSIVAVATMDPVMGGVDR